MSTMDETSRPSIHQVPDLSVVIPVRDEADNVGRLALEIRSALGPNRSFEIVFVDDASSDATVERICMIRDTAVPQIRLLRHDVGCGQSVAVLNGVRAARSEWIVTLDGDGQNDPADIPALLRALDESGGELRLIMGHRVRRNDTVVRRRDGSPDTGCGIKLFHRQTFLDLPAFNHMHRFLPALFLRAGVPIASVAVHHRPRLSGRSKYGIRNRLWVGIIDLFGVRWLIRRAPLAAHVSEE
jgi:dolichol-phosphate mannosyltransferase